MAVSQINGVTAVPQTRATGKTRCAQERFRMKKNFLNTYRIQLKFKPDFSAASAITESLEGKLLLEMLLRIDKVKLASDANDTNPFNYLRDKL